MLEMDPGVLRFFCSIVLLAFIIAQTTEFVPDEYWQSTEVASFLHFGKGHLTWEWHQGLRSYVIPLLISWLYKIGSLFGLDYSPGFLSGVPQALQLALYVYAYSQFKAFALKYCGGRRAEIAIRLMTTNWFITYCAARLIINQTELSLNMIALGMYAKRDWKSFSVAVAINFVLRPTAAIFWVPFIPEVVNAMVGWDKTGWNKYSNVISSSKIGLLVIGLGGLLDYTMTGTLSWWEFCKFNFVEDGSAEFGQKHLCWYLYSALPSILGPFVLLLPLAFFDLSGRYIRDNNSSLRFYLAWYVAVYSFLANKEIRFLLPVMPLMCCVLGTVIDRLKCACEMKNPELYDQLFKLWRIAMRLYIMISMAVAIFLGVYHQSGIRPATVFINKGISAMENPNIWILTPCYNVPVHTLMPHPTAHYEYYMCAPKRYHHLYDNGNQFFQRNGFNTVDVAGDITKKLNKTSAPDYVLAFNYTLPVIMNTFKEHGLAYEECANFFHSRDFLFSSKFVSVLCKPGGRSPNR